MRAGPPTSIVVASISVAPAAAAAPAASPTPAAAAIAAAAVATCATCTASTDNVRRGSAVLQPCFPLGAASMQRMGLPQHATCRASSAHSTPARRPGSKASSSARTSGGGGAALVASAGDECRGGCRGIIEAHICRFEEEFGRAGGEPHWCRLGHRRTSSDGLPLQAEPSAQALATPALTRRVVLGPLWELLLAPPVVPAKQSRMGSR